MQGRLHGAEVRVGDHLCGTIDLVKSWPITKHGKDALNIDVFCTECLDYDDDFGNCRKFAEGVTADSVSIT